jgi:hypothetical protein
VNPADRAKTHRKINGKSVAPRAGIEMKIAAATVNATAREAIKTDHRPRRKVGARRRM